jgi:hypothetical protein
VTRPLILGASGCGIGFPQSLDSCRQRRNLIAQHIDIALLASDHIAQL